MNFPVFLGVFTLTLIQILHINGESALQITRERGFPIPPVKDHVKPRLASKAGEGRLPITVVPKNYELSITPILDEDVVGIGENGTAPGTVTIRIQCIESTNSITLHASKRYVNITGDLQVTDVSGREINVISHDYELLHDFYTIQLGENLIADEFYDLNIDFITTIATDRYDGLYRTKYITPGTDELSFTAVTTLAAIAARQAFPCFDEPALKATFDISITYQACTSNCEGVVNYTALSNEALVTSVSPLPGWNTDIFNTTVLMSTYLAIIFVGKYTYKEADEKLSGDKPVRVYAPPYMIEKNGGDYPAEIAHKVMTFFEDYFQIQYKLNKYDSAAVADFQFSAMENYGLVTYKPSVLMYFPNETTEAERKRISQIISHESAHQWFGNLITAKWWNHIWLNEGFATYLAPKGSLNTDPEFEAEKVFLNDVVQYSMPFDSDPSYTHPVLSSDLITEPFYDRINYEKAASLIRMMEGFLTPGTLQKGLQKFLTRWSFQGTEQDDLFAVLTEQAHEDGVLDPDFSVKDIMDTWTKQAGFPLVRVSSGGSNQVYITQERFVSLPTEDSSDLDPNDLWNIPISIATQSAPSWDSYVPKLWLSKTLQLTTHSHNTSEWILLNLNGTGYYRVLYDTLLFNKILEQLENGANVISPLSRSQLIDDYFQSALISHVNIEYALELTKYLENERDSVVWDTVLTNLEYTYRMLLNDGFAFLKDHFLSKLEAAITAIGVGQGPSEKGNIVLYRLQLLDWACGMDSPLCSNYVDGLFRTWQQDSTTFLPLDLQPVIFCTAVANNVGNTAFDHVLQVYGQNNIAAHQKAYLLNSLACAGEPFQISGLLDEVLKPESSSAFPEADARILLQKLVANSNAKPIVFNFLRENLSELISKFTVKIVSEILTAVASYTNSATEKAVIENFINENSDEFSDIRSDLEKALATIQANVDWMNNFGTRIKDWLKETLQTNNYNKV